MLRTIAFVGISVAPVMLAAPALGQSGAGRGEGAPHFLYAASTSATPAPADASTVPLLGQRVEVELRNETVAQALAMISRRTGLHFVFSRDAVPVDRRVTLVADELPLADLLAELLGGVAVDVVFYPSDQVALVAREASRRGEVVGRVVEASTGRPVANARVEVVGGSPAATADASGAFRLSNVPTGVTQLRAEAPGFRAAVEADVVVGTGRPASVVIELAAAPIQLEGVVATPGWFTAPREAPTSTQRLNVEEIRRSPGAQEDVARAVSLLPGVAPTPIHRNDLIVRGGAPFENQFVVDGLEVANINHFPVQGSSGGQVSLVNLDFLRSVEFSAGGFGVSHGDRVGSLTTLTLRDGLTDRHAGKANFAATGLGMVAEGPVGTGSYLVGVRRSYFDLIFALAGESWVAGYWDANVKVTQRLGPRDEVSWTFVGALDDFDFRLDTGDDRYDAAMMAVNDDQYFSSVTWSRWLENARLQLTIGRASRTFNTFQNDTLSQRLFTNRSTETENSVRLNYTASLPAGGEIEAGAVVKYDSPLRYQVSLPGELRIDDMGSPRPLDLDTAFTTLRLGSWAYANLQLTPRLSTTVGTRIDYYDYLSEVRAAPRLSAALELGRRATLTASAGRYWQAPSAIWVAGDASNGYNLEPFRGDQVVIGLQQLLRDDLKLQLELYRKWYQAYPARVWRPQAVLAPGVEHVEADIPFGLEPLVSAGRGSVVGAELFLQKRLSGVPLYGTVSLSLNSTEFTGLDGVSRISAYDLPIAAQLAVGWRPGPLWDLGLRFRAASGLPRTPYIETGPRAGQLDFTRYNEHGRMPAFHALDLRADKRWTMGTLQITTYLDIQDVYNRDNPIAYVWDRREQKARYERAIGLLPTLGINLEF